jgi:hypothetical protein
MVAIERKASYEAMSACIGVSSGALRDAKSIEEKE